MPLDGAVGELKKTTNNFYYSVLIFTLFNLDMFMQTGRLRYIVIYATRMFELHCRTIVPIVKKTGSNP